MYVAVILTSTMTYVAVSANQRTQNHKFYLWRQNLWECIRGRATKTDRRYPLVNLYHIILLKNGSMTMSKLEISFMHSVRTCCTRITIFKHGRYSYQSNVFIQHGRFDLLLDES